ncbi:MAG: DegT/DnrJ/EryC1/StrS family aminotransferase [Paracoccaceae bacterium]
MSSKFLMQMQPWFGQEERDALNEYMSGDVFLTEFKKTWEFEKALAGFTKAKSCIAVNNGTVSPIGSGFSLGYMSFR